MNTRIILKRVVKGVKSFLKNSHNNRDYYTWIFGEWFGKKCSDSALTFANYVAQYGDESLKLFWLCDSGIDTSELNSRIVVVNRSSEYAIELQKSAGVAVMNQGYDDFSENGENYLGNAITVNVWHGVMWKKIGYDSYKQHIFSLPYIQLMKGIRSYSLFCSPSDIYTKIFSKAFKLDSSRAINCGLPRNVMFFHDSEVKKARERLLCIIESKGISINDELKIITYMPTFRDATTKSFSFSEYKEAELGKFLEDNNCVIIQKAHERNINRGAGYGSTAKSRVINIDNIRPQDLLAASDVLITDYSSCFFDYLLLDRPIIQFIYDYEYYSKKDRGLYYSWEQVDCGAVIYDEDVLIDAIKESIIDPSKHCEKRRIVREKFLTYESANNCEIVYNAIFERIKEICSNHMSI